MSAQPISAAPRPRAGGNATRNQIAAVTRKELSNLFGSPLALIFLAVFLAAVLFIFFSVENFFARGIADVRPLFGTLPLLLIVLLAALTMRQWSEEQRSGTQELLLTLPVSNAALVLGKFLAVMALIGVALALTLPLPISVALIGNLDWGPVIGGYLAALLLATAYAAIGLFVSSRTDNQIVALIMTAVIGGLLYLVGTRAVTDFVGGAFSEILRAIGTGSRFESIQRGVIDVRDLVYYLSLTLFFLLLNVVSIDSIRWSAQQTAYRRRQWLTLALVGLNLLALNVWLYPLRSLRLDLTQYREYSLSATTRDLFIGLQEPLEITAYLSDQTHPLLEPLIPQVRDMLREYEVAAGGRLTATVIDPVSDPQVEADANQLYGIRPTPLQITDRRQASVINSYFDILVRYGDQNVVLGFGDLIEVTPTATGVDVRLRNLEYDLTRAIKRVVFGFQSIDALLASLDRPVSLTLYLTPSTLPADLAAAEAAIGGVAADLAARSNGTLRYQVVNLEDPNAPVAPGFLQETYGIAPIPVALFSPDGFYAHMLLEDGDNIQVIFPPAELTEAEIRGAIEAALKRISTGFLKTIGIVTPAQQPDPLTGQVNPLTSYTLVQEQLRQEYTLTAVDLAAGVPANLDALLVLAPQNLDEPAVYALDQYLMRGGALLLATGSYVPVPDQFSGGLAVQPANNGVLGEWLAHHGVSLEDGLVMDAQNQPFPIPVVRNVGGIQVQEIRAVDYPFFVDVRPDAMADDSPIVANLPQVTLHWASPVSLTQSATLTRTAELLLQSSSAAWLNTTGNIQPDDVDTTTGEFRFAQPAATQQYPLAVALQGRFSSLFDVRAPQIVTDTAGFISRSPASSRLVVIGSGTFVEDNILNLAGSLGADTSRNSLQFVQNAVDWSVEDLDLLAIRARGSATRVLPPLSDQQQNGWEIGNYSVALLALVAIFGTWRARRRNEAPLPLIAPPGHLRATQAASRAPRDGEEA